MKLVWDKTGERIFETGVDHVALYVQDDNGAYPTAVAWNGVTNFSEEPSGAEASPIYADNIKYLSLMSAEEFSATITAITYPEEFEQCDGLSEIATGVIVGQQNRRAFGLVYRTLIGNDVVGTSLGYKLHFVYGAKASPSSKAYNTVNADPEAMELSWSISTVPVEVPGMKPTATLTIDSRKVSADKLAALEDILFGKNSADENEASLTGRLPLPAEIISLVATAPEPGQE